MDFMGAANYEDADHFFADLRSEDGSWARTRELSIPSYASLRSPYHIITMVDVDTHSGIKHTVEYSLSTGRASKETWEKQGKFHREDGPAIIVHSYGRQITTKNWCLNGRPIRGDEPSTILIDHCNKQYLKKWELPMNDPELPTMVLYNNDGAVLKETWEVPLDKDGEGYMINRLVQTVMLQKVYNQAGELSVEIKNVGSGYTVDIYATETGEILERKFSQLIPNIS